MVHQARWGGNTIDDSARFLFGSVEGVAYLQEHNEEF